MNLREFVDRGWVEVDENILKLYGYCGAYVGTDGYIFINLYEDGKRTTHALHWLVLPDKEEVDHIDRNIRNCKRDNLRPATHMQNCQNRKLNKNSTSGYKGVSLYKPNGKWRARITIRTKLTLLGYFDDPIAAAKAYDDAATVHFGEFAALNFPKGVV